jgi:RNA polymerase sigma factor (sigma-70 family)
MAAKKQLIGVLGHLRKSVFLQDGGGMTDGQLLGQFLANKDESAFAALVQRHGSMVMAVCKRVLGHTQDAEDAFQATFLVFVRKAASIRRPSLLNNWLYGVAYRTAMKARTLSARRKAREREAAMASRREPHDARRNDWELVLDQELNLIPDKYRAPILLCDLGGRTRKEAARHLGLSEGTLNSRLARGRTMLARRLARHGLAVSGAMLPSLLSQNIASASVLTAVVSSTTKAATVFVAGQAATNGLISAKVVALTEGVLKAMLLTKLKMMSAVVLMLGMVALTCGVLAGGHQTAVAHQNQIPHDGTQAANAKQATDARRAETDASKQINPDAAKKETSSGLTPGHYTGAMQLMLIDSKEVVRYDDNHSISHIEITTEDNLKAYFPDKKLGRGKTHFVDLKRSPQLSAMKRRSVWSTEIDGDTYEATAIPFSPEAYVFRLEILHDGKLIAGAQEFYAIPIGVKADHKRENQQGRGEDGAAQEVRIQQPKQTNAAPYEQFAGRLAAKQGDSISVMFEMDERNFLRYQRLLRQRQVQGPGSPLYVRLVDEKEFPHEGTLQRFESQFNSSSGTVQVEGTIPSPDHLLLTGMFVQVRMPFGPLQRVLEVPEVALHSDMDIKYLLIVNHEDTVERRDVSVGRLDGNMRIVEKGLRNADWVVVGGLKNLKPGTHVKRKVIVDGPKETQAGKTS